MMLQPRFKYHTSRYLALQLKGQNLVYCDDCGMVYGADFKGLDDFDIAVCPACDGLLLYVTAEHPRTLSPYLTLRDDAL